MLRNFRASILVLIAGFCSISRCPVFAQQMPNAAPPILEQGKFTLHKFEQPIGEETYEIRRDGGFARGKDGFQVHRPRLARPAFG